MKEVIESPMFLPIIVWCVLFVGAMIGMYVFKDKKAIHETDLKNGDNKKAIHKTDLKNGDNIKITYLPPCRNGYGTRNPYIGMEGTVHDFNGVTFNIFTGTSWLTCISIKTCKFFKKL
jgi:hypothetical protein